MPRSAAEINAEAGRLRDEAETLLANAQKVLRGSYLQQWTLYGGGAGLLLIVLFGLVAHRR